MHRYRNIFLKCCAVALFLVILLISNSVSYTLSLQSAEAHSIRLTVCDASNLQPLQNVKVYIDETQSCLYTDGKGETIAYIPAKQSQTLQFLTLVIQHEGFVDRIHIVAFNPKPSDNLVLYLQVSSPYRPDYYFTSENLPTDAADALLQRAKNVR